MKSGFIWLELLLLSFFLIMLDINYISFVFHRENMPMYFIVKKLSYASLSTINDFYSILVITLLHMYLKMFFYYMVNDKFMY